MADKVEPEGVPARRLRTLSKRTKEQLEHGEQDSVEYKVKEISKLPDQAAAGANLVALDPNLDAHTILVGVEEELLDNGVKRGKVVGAKAIDDSTDLDKLRQRIENTILNNVDPPPSLVISEENTGTDKPILVLTIKPTDPPHRVGNKYLARGNQGLRPLTQAELWGIFKATKLDPLLDELRSKDPALAGLLRVQLMLEDMSFTIDGIDRTVDDIDKNTRGEDEDDYTLGRPDEPREPTMWDLDTALDEVKENVEGAVARLEALLDMHDEPTQLGVWRGATQRRELLWTLFAMDPATQAWPEERERLAERFVSQHFAELPEFADFAANYAEVMGGNWLWRANDDPPKPYDHLARLCWAAVSRALRNPFGAPTNLVRVGRLGRRHTTELMDRVRSKHAGDLTFLLAGSPMAHELAVVELPGVTANDLLAMPDAEATAADVVTWHAAEGSFRIVLPKNGSVLAVEFLPTASTQPGTPAVDLAHELIERAQASGGSVLPLSGPGVVFDHAISLGSEDPGAGAAATAPAKKATSTARAKAGKPSTKRTATK